MFSAISGLKAHQIMLDVTANNISNVNTVGFKSQRTSFKDALSQWQRAGSGASGAFGGTNPSQIGLGVNLGAIDNLMQSGAVQATGNNLDVAIQGDGFFRLKTWTGAALSPEALYSRAGNFTLDVNGYLVSQDGYYVVGYTWDNTAQALTTTETRIQVPTTTKTVSIGQNGLVIAVDSNGAQTTIAGVTLAKFPNQAGLERSSANLWRASPNSGAESPGTPGDTTGLGTLVPGAVEMANVDLAQEFTSMISAQRGFQANTRIISAADEMLQQLANVGR
jgi:flagellar hook protein FlgE